MRHHRRIPTLSKEEHLQVIRETVAQVDSKIPVIAGTGANSTREAIHLTEEADKAGADGFLLVAPYYNKPSQEGLLAHFGALAERTQKPIVLYSIPSRCGIEISTPTVARLHEKYPHVCALKEAGGRSSKVSETACALGDDFVTLSGDDGLTLPFMACGAKGVISVASNLIPSVVGDLVRLALSGDYEQAKTHPPRTLSALQRPVLRTKPGAGQNTHGDERPHFLSSSSLAPHPPIPQNSELLGKIAESLNL